MFAKSKSMPMQDACQYAIADSNVLAGKAEDSSSDRALKGLAGHVS